MALLLAACTTPPPLPADPVLPEFPEAFSDGDMTVALPVSWWGQFDDPVLDELVTGTLSNNRNLVEARANLEASEALLRRARLNGNVLTLSSAGLSVSESFGAGSDVSLTGSAGLGASWEWDAFDRLALAAESAAFGVEVTRQLKRDIAVIVVSETAEAYLDLRGAQIRLGVAERNASLQRQGVDLLEELFRNGRSTQLDLDRAMAQYQTTLASLPTFQATIDVSLARIAALGALDQTMQRSLRQRLLEQPRPIPELGGALITGVPEDILRRRPDIRQAEARIGQQLALSREARARLFPRVTLSADVLSSFADGRALSDSVGLRLGPLLRWDGPNLDRVAADIDFADARAMAAVAAYEQTIYEALRDVEIALSRYRQEQNRRENLILAAKSAERALDLARFRFEEGVDDYLDVIDAQRTLLDAQDRLEASRLQAARTAVAVYRALGGMWTDEDLNGLSSSQGKTG